MLKKGEIYHSTVIFQFAVIYFNSNFRKINALDGIKASNITDYEKMEYYFNGIHFYCCEL